MRKKIKLESVNSTQLYIKENIQNFSYFDYCHACYQTNGYGRTGNWDGKYQNLYFSMLLPKNQYNHLVSIVSMHMLVAKYVPQVKIQVPNDLYYNGKKLGGFIIENFEDYSILGIGININGSDDEFTSVSKIINEYLDVETFVNDLDMILMQNLNSKHLLLEDYYKIHCNIIGEYIEFKDLKTKEFLTGIVTDLNSQNIYIYNKVYNQMSIKILNKK